MASIKEMEQTHNSKAISITLSRFYYFFHDIFIDDLFLFREDDISEIDDLNLTPIILLLLDGLL